MSDKHIKIIGAGLAGCEAAWQLANREVKVTLFEMKPKKFSPAHKSGDFAELVCSNSLRADGIYNAVGLLKEEMRRMSSLIMECADKTRVPAGGALAVDRGGFSAAVTERICAHPNIEVVHEEVLTIDKDEYTIIAAGPLASEGLSEEIRRFTGDKSLHFFDAAAPIVAYDSIDMNRAFRAARYGKGGDDYINCPMTREEYERFYRALITAEAAPVHDGVEDPKVFEGCMPIEVMAARGADTMRFGPLKPVGLTDPHDGSRPYAVVQLRQDNAAASMYNIVGFQTHLKFGEQKRVFGMIPGLENAEFVRYGVMHRNTFLDAPRVLSAGLCLKEHPNVFFAGQITGFEGYMESAACGLLAARNLYARLEGRELPPPPADTMCGALVQYLTTENKNFQPMGANMGILPPLPEDKRPRDKRLRYMAQAERAVASFQQWLDETAL